ncbi:hypothetical protein DFR76_112299 [Nocardia pseudobrasiliensis]|uniref:Uncharacterized protein n=1 Tax=Nocardia pseudobrasiliensis TaxID=45979 RepID=A0A370HXG6_9NOCA|nr:hypothetical protein DFR76_112299 [Nocardia pseudobrasiliensis]
MSPTALTSIAPSPADMDRTESGHRFGIDENSVMSGRSPILVASARNLAASAYYVYDNAGNTAANPVQRYPGNPSACLQIDWQNEPERLTHTLEQLIAQDQRRVMPRVCRPFQQPVCQCRRSSSPPWAGQATMCATPGGIS